MITKFELEKIKKAEEEARREHLKALELLVEEARSTDSHKTLRRLSRDEEVSVRVEVAKNPHTPLRTLRRLSWDSHYVIAALPENPKTTPRMLRRLSRVQNTAVKAAVARNPKTPKRVLKRLSRENLSVVREVAGNPNISMRTSIYLALDDDLEARRRLSENPYTHHSALNYLINDDRSVQMRVARNRNSSAKTLDRLHKDKMLSPEDESMMITIASNPSTPATLLFELFKEGEYGKRL